VTTDPEGLQSAPVSVSAQLDELRRRIASGRDQESLSADAVVLLQDLETAEEELRVADEEVRAQQEQLSRLMEDRRLLRWQHERVLSALPVAVVTTDAEGRMESVNAAFAALTGIGVDFARSKPVFSFVATSDRTDLRRDLARVASGGSGLHRMITLTPRRGGPLTVEAHVEPSSPAPGARFTWLFLVPSYDSGSGSALRLHPDLSRALVRLTTVASPAGTTTAGAAREAVEICQDAVGPELGVSLVLGDLDGPEVTTTTTAAAQRLDGAQLMAGEGPTTECIATGETVVSEDVRCDRRWRRLSRYLDPGAHAVVAVPLRSGGQVLGALAVSGAAVPPVAEVEVLASAVTAVLNELAVRSEVEEVTTAMERALASRAVIDQAKGIVMADKHCGPEQAFQHLVALSSVQHKKVREVAAALVRETGGAPAAAT
jgi:PAS domain S-box-containing protein